MKKESPQKKIIIVGAGVAGLSAGIYGQKNGFTTEIYEKNPNNGGLCFSWVRKGMPIDGCIHWLTGTRDGDDINKMWKDVDAFDQKDVINGDNFGSIEYNGKVITFWTDLDRLEKDLIAISPEDKRLIKKLKRYTIKFAKMPLPMGKPLSMMNIFDLIKIGFSMMPYLHAYIYAIHKSQSSFAKRFKSKDLAYILSRIVPGDGNLYTTLYAFGTVALGNGGVPKGGSSYIVKRMQDEYLRLGGKIYNNQTVTKFNTKQNKVMSLTLKSGENIEGDYFVTCCDAYEATRYIVNNSKKDYHITKRFIRKDKYPLPSAVYISYAVDVNALKQLNVTTTFEFPCDPFSVGKKNIESIKFRNYLYDETFIKDGKVLVTVLIHQNDLDYYYWENLRKDYRHYLEIKNEIGELVLKRLVRRFQALTDKIELLDVCTPMTYHRYVYAHRGAYMPWAFTSKGRMLMHNSSIPGLKNIFFSGQWTIMPGGLPIALMSGKFAIQHILKKEHKSYKLKGGEIC